MAQNSKTIVHVSNIAPEASEGMVTSIFCPFGQITSLSLIGPTVVGGTSTCFIEYANPLNANMAVMSMNKIRFLDRELRVSWATQTGSMTAPTLGAPSINSSYTGSGNKTSKGHPIYVGDLPDAVDDTVLHDHFQRFGPILEAKMVRNPDGSSRGYGFISFENEDDALEAITKMDRSWMISKAIRCNWATRKQDSSTGFVPNAFNSAPKSYDDVFNETAQTNTTVYCGGILSGMSDELLKGVFLEYGGIVDLRIYPDKGFAFIRYDNHAAAAKAITETHGTKLNGYYIKCSWGRDNSQQSAAASQLAAARYNMGGGMVNGNNSAGVPGAAGDALSNSAYNAYCQQYYQLYYQNYYQQYFGQNNYQTMNNPHQHQP